MYSVLSPKGGPEKLMRDLIEACRIYSIEEILVTKKYWRFPMCGNGWLFSWIKRGYTGNN